jgi:hypothetical protein
MAAEIQAIRESYDDDLDDRDPMGRPNEVPEANVA